MKVEDFDAIFDLNVRAAFFVAQTVAQRLVEAKLPGSIINISSQMGHVGAARRTVYCASKHAMEGFTKAMAIELAPHNIRVNSLGPTFLETPMTRPFFENKAFRDEVLSQDQARPARPVGGAHRRDRVPGLRRLVADDRRGAGARRRLDGGVISLISRSVNRFADDPLEDRMTEDKYQDRQNLEFFRWPELAKSFKDLVELVMVSPNNLSRQLRSELFTMASIAGAVSIARRMAPTRCI